MVVGLYIKIISTKDILTKYKSNCVTSKVPLEEIKNKVSYKINDATYFTNKDKWLLYLAKDNFIPEKLLFENLIEGADVLRDANLFGIYKLHDYANVLIIKGESTNLASVKETLEQAFAKKGMKEQVRYIKPKNTKQNIKPYKSK